METQAKAKQFKLLDRVGCLILHSNDQVAQSSQQALVAHQIVGSIPTSDSWHLCESSSRSADDRGFYSGYSG